jgi:holin-like protein
MAVVFGFAFIGEVFAYFIKAGIPASVWGIIIMYTALSLKLLRPAQIELCADFLNNNMALFFVPPSVAIIEQFDVLKYALVQFIFVCVIAAIITFFTTYYTVFFVRRIMTHQAQRNKNDR